MGKEVGMRRVSLFLFLSFVLLSQDIELVTVFERTFNDTIVDVIFDTATVTVKEAKVLGVKGLEGRDEFEIVKLEYPKVVMIGDTSKKYKGLVKSIKFLNKKGEVIKEVELKIPGEQCILSPNKKLIGVRKTYTVGTPYQDLTIYDLDGEVRGKFKVKPLEGLLIADDGSFVVYGDQIGRIPRFGSINFYDSEGLLLKEIKDAYPLPRAKYIPDTEVVIFLVGGSKFGSYKEGDVEYPKYATEVVCYDKNGEEKWRYVLKDMQPKGFANDYFTYPYEMIEFTGDSLIIIRGLSWDNKKKAWVFSTDGELIKEKEGWEK
ncbi:hypothetical protein DRQ16_03970 [bacterium]|nr:MAG: hypothetical protein DRQ16_03970 [bacterium]